MVQPSKSALAWAHQFTPPLPDDVTAESSVMVRYDGARIGEEDVIYFVIGSDDLGRLPDHVLEGLEFSVRDEEGGVHGSPDAFFIGSEWRLSLYVNTEAYPDFLDRVRDAASSVGLMSLVGHGDLHLMRGRDGDISAPAVPAFVENGLGYVPSLLAISYLERIRPQHDRTSGPELG